MKLQKDEILDIPLFYQHNDDGDYTLQNTCVQNVDGILEQNKRERESSNGFTDGRTMRKIMSLSSVDYLNALKKGYHLDCTDPALLRKEVYRYLKDIGRSAGYQTVNHISTPGHTGNIIIK